MEQCNSALYSSIPGSRKRLNSNPGKATKLTITPEENFVILKYFGYQTASLIFICKSVYLYSNGYLTPVLEESSITAKLSKDYKEITLMNNMDNEIAHGLLINNKNIKSITYLSTK